MSGAPTLRIVGTRGIPNRHGGFEAFAEALSVYLVSRGWAVTVYCQEAGDHPATETMWEGVRRVHIPVATPGALGTIIFDVLSTRHALREDGAVLVLGYNTACLSLAYRLKGIPSILNMDGMEWCRAKYGLAAKLWFLANERVGPWIANHIVADHPAIAERLRRRVAAPRLTMIPYCAPPVSEVPTAPLEALGLTPGAYGLVIARPEPENSILEIVQAWSKTRREMPLVVLGNYDPSGGYTARVLAAGAAGNVRFPGAIYDPSTVAALRAHATLYLHGHRAGGTNPSLVESLAAGGAVLAHDNEFNRWVARDAGEYFTDVDACASALDRLLAPTGASALQCMRDAALTRYQEAFTPTRVLGAYEELLARWNHAVVTSPARAAWTASHG